MLQPFVSVIHHILKKEVMSSLHLDKHVVEACNVVLNLHSVKLPLIASLRLIGWNACEWRVLNVTSSVIHQLLLTDASFLDDSGAPDIDFTRDSV